MGQEFHEDDNRLILLYAPGWPVSICPDCGQVCTEIHDSPSGVARQFWCSTVVGLIVSTVNGPSPSQSVMWFLTALIPIG